MFRNLVFLFLGALTQTVYPDLEYRTLHVTNDGRLEAFIDANDKYWKAEYGQFIELDMDTRELVIVFGVSRFQEPITARQGNSHIMWTSLASGMSTWAEPVNATKNADGCLHQNAVLWYNTMEKRLVMVYQSFCGAPSFRLQSKYSGEDVWSDSHIIFPEISYLNMHFQFVESLRINQEGYASELIIPLDHAPEKSDSYDPSDNYGCVLRVDRNFDLDDNVVLAKFEETSGYGDGYLQPSIVRVPSNNKLGSQLVAFLKDANGYWIWRSTSQDDGRSWSDPTQSAIPNPDQSSQAIYLHSDLLMLIYNPTQAMTSSAVDAFSNCHHLAVALSSDYGMTWEFSRMIEYAYDGRFNNPVGLQDPLCDNIYLTYSVMTDQVNGCKLLDECNVDTQGTKNFVKFTVINEQWVMNDFRYSYDYDDCAWKIPETFMTFKTTKFDTIEAGPPNLTMVKILSILTVALLLFNMGACYLLIIRKMGYHDLEGSQEVNHPNNYETTNI